MTKRADRADRFVSDADAFTLHRAPGKPPIPGIPRQTIQPDADSPRRSLGLGTVRRARHVNQAAVAQRMGVAQPTVSEIERGADPKLSTIIGYLLALDASKVTIVANFDDGEIALPVDIALEA